MPKCDFVKTSIKHFASVFEPHEEWKVAKGFTSDQRKIVDFASHDSKRKTVAPPTSSEFIDSCVDMIVRSDLPFNFLEHLIFSNLFVVPGNEVQRMESCKSCRSSYGNL